MAAENHQKELKELMDEHGHVGAEVRKTIGDVGTAFVVAGVGSGIVVVQAPGVSLYEWFGYVNVEVFHSKYIPVDTFARCELLELCLLN